MMGVGLAVLALLGGAMVFVLYVRMTVAEKQVAELEAEISRLRSPPSGPEPRIVDLEASKKERAAPEPDA